MTKKSLRPEKEYAVLERKERAILMENPPGPKKEQRLEEIRQKKEELKPLVKERRKKRRSVRLIAIALLLVLLGLFLPKLIGISIITLLHEIMTGNYRKVEEIQDRLLGRNK
jgi:hypothetical protein